MAELVFTLHEGSQPDKPKTVDITSSLTKVYIRRNIQQIERENDDGSITKLWQYEEAITSPQEFDEIVAMGVQSLENSTSIINDTIDVVLSETIPEQSEQITTLNETIDDILTNVIPSMMEG